MSNSAVPSLSEKPPFNIHDAICGDHGLFYGADEQVKTILTNAGKEARVLDFRSASGQWVYAVAGLYPDATVVGLDDRDPASELPTRPENVKFIKVPPPLIEVARWVDAKFDLIHARAASATVPDFKRIIRESMGLLRPGGMLLLTSGELALFDADGKEVTSNGSELLKGVKAYQISKGMDMLSMYTWRETITEIAKEMGVPFTIAAELLPLTFTRGPSSVNFTTKFMQDSVDFFSINPAIPVSEVVKEGARAELKEFTIQGEGPLHGSLLRWPLVRAVRDTASG